MSYIIGIDLGTSTTEAAIYRDGKPEMILNFEHEEITPSAIGIDDAGNWVVGEKAMAQYILSPERTAIEIKRKIGTGEKISIGKSTYSAVELSAKLLEYVRTYASEALGEDVSRAVISVPAYFNDIQRQETVAAGNLAGFEVERILNEPTSAAISYGLEHMEESSHVLVYDLGGGTFDVTLLEMFEGILEVKASNGDNQLGGKDFDEKIIQLLISRFAEKTGIHLEKDRHAMVQLKKEAEACKKTLSREPSAHVLIPMIAQKGGKPVALDETITQEEFEELVHDLIERTHAPIDIVLEDSRIAPEQIDRIILVGGSTRMPIVAKDIEAYLGKKPSRAVNPDYAVAEGAAIQAAIISGDIDTAEGLLVTDVNPYTLGIQVSDNYRDDNMSVIIPRNTTIPVTRTEQYCTHYNNQTEVDVRVYQGESAYVGSNHFLNSFTLGNIPPRPAHEEKVDVEFSYDLNGILQVRATVVSTGRDASITINMKEGSPSGSGEVDIESWKDAPGAAAHRAVIRKAERILKNTANNIEPASRTALENAVRALKLAIISGSTTQADDAEYHLIEMLNFLEE